MARAIPFSKSYWQGLDEKIKFFDEDVWLSSRYAVETDRKILIALYYFGYELGRIKFVAKQPLAGQARFAWWRTRLEDISQAGGADSEYMASDGERALAFGLKSVDMAEYSDLIDSYEAEFLGQSGHVRPHWQLLKMAASALEVNLSDEFEEVLEEFTRIKLSAPLQPDVQTIEWSYVPPLSPALRPLLGHLRLRRLYGKGDIDPKQRPLARRFCVFLGILTGRI